MSVPYSKNPVFKAETILNMEPKQCLDMQYPFGPFRFKWDTFVEACHLIKTINEVFIVYVKKYFLFSF